VTKFDGLKMPDLVMVTAINDIAIEAKGAEIYKLSN